MYHIFLTRAVNHLNQGVSNEYYSLLQNFLIGFVKILQVTPVMAGVWTPGFTDHMHPCR